MAKPSKRAEGMGIGELANPTNIFKRKFRWTLSFTLNCTTVKNKKISEKFVKTANRPKLTIDETQIDYLNARMFIPGKGVWETLSVSYYDVTNQEMVALWTWLNSVYQIFEGVKTPMIMEKKMGGQLGDYTGTGELMMYDGCGYPIEKWQLFNAWPKELDFGELDMASSEVCEIKATFRYSDVGYENYCIPQTPENCCNQCP